MERHTTHIYSYSNFIVGMNHLVQGLGLVISLLRIGSKAAERARHISFHPLRNRKSFCLKYTSTGSLFFSAYLNRPVKIYHLLCPA